MTIDEALSLAVAHENAGRLTDAQTLYRQVVAQVPDHAPAQYHLGVVLQRLGRFEESIEPFERAAALRPGGAEAWVNLANAYRGAGRMEEALVPADRAVALSPNLPEAHFNRGAVLHMLARFDDAMNAYDRAIALKPDFARARLNRAILLLLLGDFERGLCEYEWRIPLLPRRAPPGAVSLTRLGSSSPSPGTPGEGRGEGPLAGKRVLVDMEQGFGDAIQFCRYVPMLAPRGATVIVRVHHSLVPLINTLEGATEVVPLEARPAFDLHAWMLSLPLLFRTRMETIPAKVPYLFAEEQRVESWRARIGETTDLRVGLCWSGNPSNTDNVNRSIPPALLKPLLSVPGVRYFSLQKDRASGRDDARGVAPRLNGLGNMVDLTPDLRDWADTGALMQCLDMIVTIDTGILHLAGALARPTWGMITHVPDWRYFLGREDSPWNPTVRLYRQPARGDWPSVIERIRADLAAEVTRRAKH